MTTAAPAPVAEKRKLTNLKVHKPHPEHRVKVRDMEYPAHPFTVRVSDLSPCVEDMDLVDAFSSRCGAVVHARILRDRGLVGGAREDDDDNDNDSKGQSRGEGLVQFEERESVEKALSLDGILGPGAGERLMKVGRSHIPAVPGVVPPGMHRARPRGGGRNTRRNRKKREMIQVRYQKEWVMLLKEGVDEAVRILN